MTTILFSNIYEYFFPKNYRNIFHYKEEKTNLDVISYIDCIFMKDYGKYKSGCKFPIIYIHDDKYMFLPRDGNRGVMDQIIF